MSLDSKRIIIAGLGALFLVSLVLVQWIEASRRRAEAGLREPHVVKRGDSLTMIFSNAGLSIVGTVVALQPGATGKTIRVRNPDTGAVITGVVEADGTIRAGGRR